MYTPPTYFYCLFKIKGFEVRLCLDILRFIKLNQIEVECLLDDGWKIVYAHFVMQFLPELSFIRIGKYANDFEENLIFSVNSFMIVSIRFAYFYEILWQDECSFDKKKWQTLK